MKRLALIAVLCVAASAAAFSQPAVAPFVVKGDAIEAPLLGRVGNAGRGAAVVRNRETGNCLICHAVPDPGERFQGDLAPLLAGVGNRLNAGQIRLRLVDPTRVNNKAIMPAYHRIAGFVNVDARYAGQPVLTAQEIEDAVAYLVSLKE